MIPQGGGTGAPSNINPAASVQILRNIKYFTQNGLWLGRVGGFSRGFAERFKFCFSVCEATAEVLIQPLNTLCDVCF